MSIDMNRKHSKGKSWSDYKYPKDPDEYGYVKIVKKFPINRTIDVKELRTPLFKDRFENEVADDEVDYISKIPLKVVKSRESDKFIVVEGIRYLIEGEKQNLKKFKCSVIDEVDLDVHAYIPRFEHIFKDHQPFHILEQATALEEIKRLVISKFGDDKIFRHGGDRRSKNYKNHVTLVDMLKEKLHGKRYFIEGLIRFNKNASTTGHRYLYKILKLNNQKLSISKIRELNSKMRKMGLRKEVESLVKDLEKQNESEDKIQRSVAYLIYDVLFKSEKKLPEIERPAKEAPEDDNGNDSTSPKVSEEESIRSIPKKNNSIGTKDLDQIKKAFKKVFLMVAKIMQFFLKKQSLNGDDIDKLNQLIDSLQSTFTDFNVELLKPNSRIKISHQ